MIDWILSFNQNYVEDLVNKRAFFILSIEKIDDLIPLYEKGQLGTIQESSFGSIDHESVGLCNHFSVEQLIGYVFSTALICVEDDESSTDEYPSYHAFKAFFEEEMKDNPIYKELIKYVKENVNYEEGDFDGYYDDDKKSKPKKSSRMKKIIQANAVF